MQRRFEQPWEVSEDDDVLKVRHHRERCESLSVDQSQQMSGVDADDVMTADDYFMMDMSDTLFSSLNFPTFNTPRDLCIYSLLTTMMMMMMID